MFGWAWLFGPLWVDDWADGPCFLFVLMFALLGFMLFLDWVFVLYIILIDGKKKPTRQLQAYNQTAIPTTNPNTQLSPRNPKYNIILKNPLYSLVKEFQ